MSSTESQPVLLSAAAVHQGFAPVQIAEAVLIEDGLVTAAGALSEVRGAAPQGTEEKDLTDSVVIPGLVESHAHLAFTGMTSQWADLRPEQVADFDALAQKLAAAGSVDGWYRGWGYDDTLLAEKEHPDRTLLDRVSTTEPVLITHISGHFAVANSVALERAGITAETPDPPEGRFVRDGSGNLTGLLWEVGAVGALKWHLPEPQRADGLRVVADTTARAASRGITQIHDLGVGSQFGADEAGLLQELDAQGGLPVRVFGYIAGALAAPMLEDDPDLFRHPVRGNYANRGVKMWADGSIQGLSAALQDEYTCCPGSHGDLLLTADQIVERARPLAEAGAQIAVHANGDAAIDTVISALRQLGGSGPDTGMEHRIEHFQMAHPDHVRACAQHRIAVSVFANHVFQWGDRHRDIFVGPERAQRMNPLRECVDSGLTTGVHSDSPITDMDILRTLHTAVTRRTRDGHVLGADQAITPQEALHIATAGSAALVGAQDWVGRLVPGQAADLVVLDRDPLRDVEPGTSPFADLTVRATMVGGRWVHGS